MIKIYLRDINEKVVQGWDMFFGAEPNVECSWGDIFKQKADAIVSPANSFGFMDGGIDALYTEQFGYQLQERLQKKIDEEFYGELVVGQATIVETASDGWKYLISAPTMRVPSNVSETTNAYLSFRAVLIEIKKFNKANEEQIQSVICPGLGTAIGRMSPFLCAYQMHEAYKSIMKQNGSVSSLGEAYVRHKQLLKKMVL